MKTGRELIVKWVIADKENIYRGYFEYCRIVKLKILDFIIRSNDLTISRANQVATNTYEVFNALIWYEDFLIKGLLFDLETKEGWFYMIYEKFEENFGIKKDVVKNAVKILGLMGWIETKAEFRIVKQQPRKFIHYRIVQSKIAEDAGIEK